MKKFTIKKMVASCVLSAIIVSSPLTATAHPGRIDSHGGHWDRKTGTYHYHRGGNSGNHTSSQNDEENGWVYYLGQWMYYEHGVPKSEWIESSDGVFYLDPETHNRAEGWKKMSYGLDNPSGGWYFFNTDGKIVRNGWKYINEKWYHFNTNGCMETGWIKEENRYYYCNSYGSMLIGWCFIDGYWYYFFSNGIMAANGWYVIDGKWYYFYRDGKMASDTKIGRYYVGADGALVDTLKLPRAKYDPKSQRKKKDTIITDPIHSTTNNQDLGRTSTGSTDSTYVELLEYAKKNLQEAQTKLNNIKSQKIVLLYTENGWIRTYDHDAADAAQKEVDYWQNKVDEYEAML